MYIHGYFLAMLSFDVQIFSIILICSLFLVLAFKFEVSGENVIDHVVQIVPVDEAVSLVTRVHSNPAELVARDIVFHVGPHWFAHDRHGILVGQH